MRLPDPGERLLDPEERLPDPDERLPDAVVARLRELLPDLLAAPELPELPVLRDLLLRVEPVD